MNRKHHNLMCGYALLRTIIGGNIFVFVANGDAIEGMKGWRLPQCRAKLSSQKISTKSEAAFHKWYGLLYTDNR